MNGLLQQLFQELETKQFSITKTFFSEKENQAWLDLYKELEPTFKKAGIGGERKIVSDNRGDYHCWLEDEVVRSKNRSAYERLNEFQQGFSEYFRRRLTRRELQFALYPCGAYYKRHTDLLQHSQTRVLSMVHYLNQAWHLPHAGELIVYHKDRSHIVAPIYGTTVFFMSFLEHEVKPTLSERKSLTAWFLGF